MRLWRPGKYLDLYAENPLGESANHSGVDVTGASYEPGTDTKDLFPEFFNAPLMAENNHLPEAEAIRELAKYTDKIVSKFSELSISYNINIISGSMPEIKNEILYNVGYLCKRDGTIERYEKLHVTPDEAKVWGMQGGHELKAFDTDCGKIGILICYDSEFPELSRLLADEGMDILFVPFLTDTQNGYSRVRHCAQARAIENECYVAIAGSVGNLPKVNNMDIQFAQSMVLTPCDFSFPANGIKAEATTNTEMILIADVDLDLLKEQSLSILQTISDFRASQDSIMGDYDLGVLFSEYQSDVSAVVANEWGLPEVITEAITYYTHFEDTPNHPETAATVQFSHQLATHMHDDVALPVDVLRTSPALQLLNLYPEDIDDLLTHADTIAEDVKALSL
mgnify:CR=1 FL=1